MTDDEFIDPNFCPLCGEPYFVCQCVMCSACCALREVDDPRWRWNGKRWEHKCGDAQAGYFPAVEPQREIGG